MGLLFLSSCAYKFGYQSRKLPQSYQQISVPMFSNITQEVGLEAYFTNALIQEFERSQVAKVSSRNLAPVYVKGEITGVHIRYNSQDLANNQPGSMRYLPKNTVINTAYRIVVDVQIDLVRSSDKKVIWSQNFSDERVYNSAQISLPGLNTANPLYNNSAKHQNMKVLALDMMKEAHDRMTERF